MKKRRGRKRKILAVKFISSLKILVMILIPVIASDNQCPVECSCLGNAVICKDLQLVGAPNGLPPWTENLILKGNKFTNLKFDALLHLSKLQELDVNSNILTDNFTLSLSQESKLKWLKINNNKLTQIPESTLLHLTHLFLSHNMINAITNTALAHYPQLQYLDLSGNKLTFIKRGSFSISKLKYLNLSSNQIISIESNSFENLTSLQELRLNKNRLTVLKDYLKRLDRLRILEANRNDLDQIDALTFKDLKSLEKLHLKRNNIETLHDGAFWPLNNLVELQLDYNVLNLVPKGALFGLDHLQLFTLSHNKISMIEPQAWDMCKEITELDLSHNELNRIERLSFISLRKLRKLKLDHNAVTYIAEGAFKDLISLQELELNANKISYIVEDAIGIFGSLLQLQKLAVAHNEIKSINKNAFNGLSKVKELDLTGNNITSIQENAFSSMALTLTTLKMNTSSLFCDCGLKWLSVWLRINRFNDTRIRCGYPYWLRGMPLVQLHHTNFTCDEFPKPRIVEEPMSQLSIRGNKVSLRCKATSSADAPLSFIWKHDNLEIRDLKSQSNSESTTVDGLTIASSTLELTNVTNAHAGRYQCMVSNNYGTTYSPKAKISVLVYPSFSKKPHDIRVTAGRTARLECSATGLPTPQIAWQKDGGNDFPAARERRMHKMPTDDVLFIIDVKSIDSGIYSCTAQNLAGIIIANATLTILEMPSFIKPMENKEVIAGDSIVIECMATGSPKPHLSWRKNGSPLQATERHFLTAENQLLIIVNTVVSDAGTYECEMSNSLGSTVGASLLTIKAEPNSMVNEDDMLGLIIITVVSCAVGTSIIWVVIIYQTRKRLNTSQNRNLDETNNQEELKSHLHLDATSQHSKDSGTGNSANPSSEQLQFCTTEEIITTINNEDDVNNTEGEDSLLYYTNHERHNYDQLHLEHEVNRSLISPKKFDDTKQTKDLVTKKQRN